VHESLVPLATALYWVVASSLKGTVLIGLVVIVRRFLEAATAARLRYVLWLPVLIGLLCPVGPSLRLDAASYLADPHSFSPRAEPTLRELQQRTASGAVGGMREAALIARADASPPRAARATTRAAHLSTHGAYPSTRAAYRLAPATYFATLGWIAAAWMGVAAILGFTYLGSLLKYWRIRRRAHSADRSIAATFESCRTELRLRANVRVLESAEIDSPAVFGWWRPKLLLPAGLHRRIGTPALRHVILHELAHVKGQDVLVNWLGAAAQMLHWFNPAVWLAMRGMRRDMEHACDARVLSLLTETERADYGKMLIRLSDTNTAEAATIYGLGVADRHSDLKERLIMISGFNLESNGAKLVVCLALAGFTSVALTQPSLAPQSQAAGATPGPPRPPIARELRLADAKPAANAPTPSRADGVPLQKLVEQVAANIHRRVIVDPRASSSVILYGQNLDQINYSDFLTILRINGLTAVDINDYVNVVPITEVRWLPLPAMSSDRALPPDQFADMSLVLKNACAVSLVPILRPRLPNYAYLAADKNTNSIMAIDTYANLKKIRAQISELESRTKPGLRCGGTAM
jgi:beta-lactamase regulating signal transducer with metallopeptidase domain